MNTPTEALTHLRSNCRSLLLATVGAEGAPDASYAPFAEDEGGAFLILVSGLARHTGNLLRSGQASALLIDDEATTGQIFARRRVTYLCSVDTVARDSTAWRTGLEALQRRHGAVIATLRDLSDFQLLRLVPKHGMLVLGFGQAWRLTGPACTELQPVGPR